MTITRTINNSSTSEMTNSVTGVKLTITATLTPTELEAAYRTRHMQYLVEDAKRQCNDLNYHNLIDADFINLAVRFEENKDCNRADNDTWESIITEYVRQKGLV